MRLERFPFQMTRILHAGSHDKGSITCFAVG
jgi:hypothetical protein